MGDFIQEFSSKIIDWYLENKRDLPWRNTKDPYFIWLSEIILQQTRIQQGLPYYEHFTEQYPTVHDLANASENQVMKSWEGLGYYSRARNLHTTAKYVSQELNGVFPNNYNELIKLKGVGDYTASAIASFAFDEAKPAIDGNVYRILSRLFDVDLPIDQPEGKKYFKALAEKLISKDDPANFNQATMEFGATLCTPKKALCMYCPFEDQCEAKANGTILERPIKKKKLVKKNRFFDYLIFKVKNQVLVHKRGDKDIWKGLHDYFLIEGNQMNQDVELLLKSNSIQDLLSDKQVIFKQSECNYQQVLTHQKLHINFHIIELEKRFKIDDSYEWISIKNLEKIAFPKTIKLFTNNILLYL